MPGENKTISILFISGAGAKTYSLERNLAELIFLHFIRETQERSYPVVAIDVRRHAPSEREAARRDVREELIGMDISTIFQLLVAASVEQGRTLHVGRGTKMGKTRGVSGSLVPRVPRLLNLGGYRV